MKKILSILLGIALLASATSCTQSGKNDSAETSATKADTIAVTEKITESTENNITEASTAADITPEEPIIWEEAGDNILGEGTHGKTEIHYYKSTGVVCAVYAEVLIQPTVTDSAPIRAHFSEIESSIMASGDSQMMAYTSLLDDDDEVFCITIADLTADDRDTRISFVKDIFGMEPDPTDNLLYFIPAELTPQ